MNTIVDINAQQFFESVNNWYANATVRNSARIRVSETDNEQFFYPLSRQLLGEHPKVQALGQPAVAYVLAQSAYRYMYDICLLETRFVIDCSLNIIGDVIEGASEEEKLDALTVVIDEGYHAHVALDFIIQMKRLTGIEPLQVPHTHGILQAVARALERLPAELHSDFQLITVTLAEHTLTKDLLSIGREKDTTEAFTQVMTDHVSDEGRHASYFAKLMSKHWARLPEAHKQSIGALLPDYLDEYLAGDEGRVFDRQILRGCGLDEQEVDAIIADTQACFWSRYQAYTEATRANLVKLLRRCGVFEHQPTREVFFRHDIEL
ncbi:MAG: diiron oxygenase [Pseudomonadota bacterium]